ncbi:MAG: GNAT family N-acetyltransferase [Actinobacteria bacterium]|nr:GNAT family N-acetyltransferase [Actinomycetota bacterium]
MSTVTAATLADLVRAALPDEDLTAADVLTCCGGEGSVTLGDGDAAAVVNIRHFGDAAVAWIVLIAVTPELQRQGRGRALVDDSVAYARDQGARELHLGTAVPRYVWPGVDFRFTAALALFESCGFEPYGAECNMAISTAFRAPIPDGVVVTREDGDGALELVRRHHPMWEDEVRRATENGVCLVARDRDGTTIGVGCHSVNRHGHIGPMATDPRHFDRGVGHAVLGAICADVEAVHGLGETEVTWVGPVAFYAKAGARVSRVFRTAKLPLVRHD